MQLYQPPEVLEEVNPCTAWVIIFCNVYPRSSYKISFKCILETHNYKRKSLFPTSLLFPHCISSLSLHFCFDFRFSWMVMIMTSFDIPPTVKRSQMGPFTKLQKLSISSQTFQSSCLFSDQNICQDISLLFRASPDRVRIHWLKTKSTFRSSNKTVFNICNLAQISTITLEPNCQSWCWNERAKKWAKAVRIKLLFKASFTKSPLCVF